MSSCPHADWFVVTSSSQAEVISIRSFYKRHFHAGIFWVLGFFLDWRMNAVFERKDATLLIRFCLIWTDPHCLVECSFLSISIVSLTITITMMIIIMMILFRKWQISPHACFSVMVSRQCQCSIVVLCSTQVTRAHYWRKHWPEWVASKKMSQLPTIRIDDPFFVHVCVSNDQSRAGAITKPVWVAHCLRASLLYFGWIVNGDSTSITTALEHLSTMVSSV